MNPSSSSEPEPLTPEQSKAQVVDAAKELVGTLDIAVAEAFFWHSSCNDQGEAPFRGQVRIAYPPAPSREESEREVAAMAQRLMDDGWRTDTDFKSHGTVLRKGDVVAVLGPQTASVPHRDIRLFGECRDMTTTKDQTGTQPITLD